MKMKKLFALIAGALCLSFFIGIDMQAQADFINVLNNISRTAETVNSVNRAGRGTMSTIESAQRFTDRQQDRKDEKRAQKEYNANAEQEYYRTLQETQALRQQYRFNDYNNL
ncbi:hypothetical protein IJ182_09195 [bacterium]|nr:hypothetical protein [bacterium]